MRLFKTIALCLTALFCAAVYAQDKRRVAVLEPEGNEAVTMMNKANVRGALTEIIVNTGAYTAVSRSHTDRILKEHGFQRGELSDSSRAKELGKLLGADLICVTELLREGGEFNIECSIINVETGEITNSASEFLQSDSNAAIRRAAEDLVRRMFRMSDMSDMSDSWAASEQTAQTAQTAQPAQGQSQGKAQGQTQGQTQSQTQAQTQAQAQSKEVTPQNHRIREAKTAINSYGLQLGALMPQGELSDGASAGFGLTAYMERVWSGGWALRARLEYTHFGEKTYNQAADYGSASIKYQARQTGAMLDIIYYRNSKDTIYPFAGLGYFDRSLNVSVTSPGPGQNHREGVDLDSGIACCLGAGWKFTPRIGAELKYVQADWKWVQLSLLYRF